MTGILVLLLLTVQGISSTPAQSNKDEFKYLRAAAFPCPIPEDIHPCVCWTHITRLNLDCTDVTSEQELANVFLQDFPEKEFYQFRINHTETVVYMNFNTNGVSFEKIYLSPGPVTIRGVSDYFLLNSHKTLTIFETENSQLTEAGFPLDELNNFEILDRLIIYNSNVAQLPNLLSQNLSYLDITFSDLTHLYPGKSFIIDLKSKTYRVA